MSRIYLTGASCSGVTTLGAGLARALHAVHVDCDDFYWMPTDPPFTEKRPVDERVQMIGAALGDGAWVLSGSFDGWGDCLISTVDLIVMVITPTPVRMARLEKREKQRYGDRILPGNDMHENHKAFAEWASRYDDPTFTSRSLHRHLAWLAAQTAPTLRVDGCKSELELVAEVLDKLHQHRKKAPH
ncbi:Adenylate kinase [Hyphomicrobium sp. 1Nfss2.1]|uniref:ATP-binding protein n=1 Tax=Hyphomicrobium sp. 1Nfss2.1 TaxID=3413936 RepID=UPI003C7D8FBB